MNRFLCDAFDNDELHRLCVQNFAREVARALPAVEIPRDKFCFAAVEALKRFGVCDDAFFDLLRRERNGWRRRIDAIQHIWRIDDVK